MPHTYSLQNVPSYVAAGEAHYHQLLAEATEARRFVPEPTRHAAGAWTVSAALRRATGSVLIRLGAWLTREVSTGDNGDRPVGRIRDPVTAPVSVSVTRTGGRGQAAALTRRCCRHSPHRRTDELVRVVFAVVVDTPDVGQTTLDSVQAQFQKRDTDNRYRTLSCSCPLSPCLTNDPA